MKKKIVLWIILGVVFISCDPTQTIEFQNKCESSSIIKLYFNGKDYYKFDKFLTKDSLILQLEPTEKEIFNFGLGTWNVHNSLDSLVSRVDKIRIETEKSTELFESKSQVDAFFRDRLIDDRYMARIIIEIK
ncbi:hypothetical protein N9B82_03720 [Saprospiraceae bacterium]|nr:hypothetical protein [Saprospiraceae bacterium]